LLEQHALAINREITPFFYIVFNPIPEQVLFVARAASEDVQSAIRSDPKAKVVDYKSKFYPLWLKHLLIR
jgi:hypothetical protein